MGALALSGRMRARVHARGRGPSSRRSRPSLARLAEGAISCPARSGRRARVFPVLACRPSPEATHPFAVAARGRVPTGPRRLSRPREPHRALLVQVLRGAGRVDPPGPCRPCVPGSMDGSGAASASAAVPASSGTGFARRACMTITMVARAASCRCSPRPGMLSPGSRCGPSPVATTSEQCMTGTDNGGGSQYLERPRYREYAA